MCLEDYLFEFYENNAKEYLTKLDPLQSSDMSMLPQSKQKDWQASIKNAGMIFNFVDDIKNAKTAMDNAAVAYLPIHSEVRKTERKIVTMKKKLGSCGVTYETKLAHVRETVSSLKLLNCKREIALNC